jgi:hypothetical protein
MAIKTGMTGLDILRTKEEHPGLQVNPQCLCQLIHSLNPTSRTGDPAVGDFSDAKVIRKFGDVPDDLSAL